MTATAVEEGDRPEILDPEGEEARVIHELISFDGQAVVEIGCGDGRLTRRYAAGAATVLALDPDEAKIRRAHELTPEALLTSVTFRVADATTVELPDAAFDVAVLSWSI